MLMDQSLADQLVDRAIRHCADQKFSGDDIQTRQALWNGRCDVCMGLSNYLVRQVSEYLGQLDRTVKAVYQYEPENSALRSGSDRFPSSAEPAGINLVAWVERKSAALSALAGTLENVIIESRKRIHCPDAVPACYALDIQMVDDRDVQERRGLGLFISNQYLRSTQVWHREAVASSDLDHIPGAGDIPAILSGSLDAEALPENMLFEQAHTIENFPDEQRQAFTHRLREIKVALIRRLISDQLGYINIAKEWFTIDDLADIRDRKIGFGRIGGKAAGMLLARRILSETMAEPGRSSIYVPDSFFIGSDVLYLFMAMNGLMHWNNQKYKSEEQIRAEYPRLRDEFEQGEFPPEILNDFSLMLDRIGQVPIIVRSSSLLEDNFGATFAGKYKSVFLPNNASPQENLYAFSRTVASIYGSGLHPDTLLYRRGKGLQDYDERMAILVQAVQGESFGQYFFPFGSGVAFSRNLYRWSPQIRKGDGFVRLVWGLGTRAVERVGNDYPRLVALSHPTLQPDDSPDAIRYYSQQIIDLIDMEDCRVKSLPIRDVIRPDYPDIKFLAQIEEEGFISTPKSRVMTADIPRLAVTFSEFLRRSPFASTMNQVLHTLEEHYHVPVDVEFTVRMVDRNTIKPGIQISLLQCRPQSYLPDYIPTDRWKRITPSNTLFQTGFMVPQGFVTGIQYIIYIPPEAYFNLPDMAARNQLRSLISQLNQILPEKSFICIGPGRWGTINPDLGVFVSYADIHRSASLIELSGEGIGPAPDPSLGTHFFQDLMEARIYPLAVCLDHSDSLFHLEILDQAPNCIQKFIAEYSPANPCVHLIQINDIRPGYHLELIMDDDQGKAAAYFSPD